MYILTIILGVVLFNIVVTGQTLEKRPISLPCALLRCYTNVDCEREPNNRCCLLCPQKKRCYYKKRWYDHGQSFKDSCNTCFCNNGNVGCTKKMCPPAGCYHNGQFYPEGSSFKDDCNNCTCKQGTVSCTEMACGGPCLYKGKLYKLGQAMPSERKCWYCYCRRGERYCTPPMCPACVGPIRPGQCCPDCSGIGLQTEQM
ncbi:hypothetical protein ACF0H5_011687 [Mactra antiquata]